MQTPQYEAPTFETVVWATDGSENAARALPYARALLDREHGMLVAVHIILEQPAAGVDQGRSEDGSQSDGGAAVRQLVTELQQDGVNALIKAANYLDAQPAKAIADIAKDVSADVIVLGTRGHGAIGGLLARSVTQHLLHIAPCPVLAVPPATRPTAELEEIEAAATT